MKMIRLSMIAIALLTNSAANAGDQTSIFDAKLALYKMKELCGKRAEEITRKKFPDIREVKNIFGQGRNWSRTGSYEARYIGDSCFAVIRVWITSDDKANRSLALVEVNENRIYGTFDEELSAGGMRTPNGWQSAHSVMEWDRLVNTIIPNYAE
jgi:hypothetical protein